MKIKTNVFPLGKKVAVWEKKKDGHYAELLVRVRQTSYWFFSSLTMYEAQFSTKSFSNQVLILL